MLIPESGKRRISVELLLAWAVCVHGTRLGMSPQKWMQGEDVPVPFGKLDPKGNVREGIIIPSAFPTFSILHFTVGFSPQRARQDLGSGSVLTAAQLWQNGSMTWFKLAGAAERKYLMELPASLFKSASDFSSSILPSYSWNPLVRGVDGVVPSPLGDRSGFGRRLSLVLYLCKIPQSEEMWNSVCVLKGAGAPGCEVLLLLSKSHTR